MVKVIPSVAVLLVCLGAAVLHGQAEEPRPRATSEGVEPKPDARADEPAAEETEPVEEQAENPADEKDKEVRTTMMERTLPEVTFDKVGFSDVIDFLRDVSNINIFVNWRALEAAGIERNAQVSLRLKNVTLRKGLQTILHAVAGGRNKLAYDIEDGVVTVSTAEDLGRNTHTRVYDIREILNVDGKTPDDQQEKRLATLMKLITRSVAPDSWRDQGGSSGAIRELQGQLIVTQMPEEHDAITNLLNQTRLLLGLEPMKEPAPVQRQRPEGEKANPEGFRRPGPGKF